MTHGRQPRQQRTRVRSPLRAAAWRASKLDAHQVAHIITPVQQAFKALREGVATEWQWAHLVSAMNIADAVNLKTPIRGSRGHIQLAQLALDGIKHRAMATGEWKPTSLHYEELDHVRDGVTIYHHQLTELSRGEYLRAEAHALADVRTAGGVVLQRPQQPTGQQLAIQGM